MKKLLIGLLTLTSISSFANDELEIYRDQIKSLSFKSFLSVVKLNYSLHDDVKILSIEDISSECAKRLTEVATSEKKSKVVIMTNRAGAKYVSNESISFESPSRLDCVIR